MKKVTCIIIAPLTKGFKINQKCLDSVLEQDWGNFDILIRYEKPVVYEHMLENVYKNCSKNREAARIEALAGDADYFLFLDDDILLPPDAISQFMLQTGKKTTTMPVMNPKTGEIIPVGTDVPEIHIQGGWYPIYSYNEGTFAFYPCGKFVADHTVFNFRAVEKSLIACDFVGMGCCFISREVLEKVQITHGLDIGINAPDGHDMLGGECLAFGNAVFAAGYAMRMNGSVVCEHKKRGRFKKRFKNIIRRLIKIK